MALPKPLQDLGRICTGHLCAQGLLFSGSDKTGQLTQRCGCMVKEPLRRKRPEKKREREERGQKGRHCDQFYVECEKIDFAKPASYEEETEATPKTQVARRQQLCLRLKGCRASLGLRLHDTVFRELETNVWARRFLSGRLERSLERLLQLSRGEVMGPEGAARGGMNSSSTWVALGPLLSWVLAGNR